MTLFDDQPSARDVRKQRPHLLLHLLQGSPQMMQSQRTARAPQLNGDNRPMSSAFSATRGKQAVKGLGGTFCEMQTLLC